MITQFDLFVYSCYIFKEGLIMGLFSWVGLILIIIQICSLIKHLINKRNYGGYY
jgi:hypothetical protein